MYTALMKHTRIITASHTSKLTLDASLSLVMMLDTFVLNVLNASQILLLIHLEYTLHNIHELNNDP